MDINNLLNQLFTGQNNNQSPQQENTTDNSNSWTDKVKNIAQQSTQGGLGGFAGGAVTGGLVSLLFTSGKARQLAGGILGYGGAAALGAMAMKAYQNYQTGQGASLQPEAGHGQINGANNNAFGVILIKSMVMAAKIDGHLDGTEQQKIFEALEKSSLSADEKGLVLDALSKPIHLSDLTKNIQGPEQGAQVYLASRIAIDPDQPAEKEYLHKLATELKLPPALVTELETQVQNASK